MDIDDLRLFLRLVEAGSLRQAAVALGSSGPTITRRLAALEQRLGVRLLERNARRFLLTEQGALLHDRARAIVRAMEDTEAELSTHSAALAGTLRVSAPSEIGRRVIAPLIATFRAIHPGIEIQLFLSDAGLHPVDDRLDIALRTNMPDDPSLVVRTILRSRRLVCATPDYLARHGTPQTPEDLLQHDCLRLIRGDWVFDEWFFQESGHRRSIRVNGTLASDSGAVIHKWVLDGLGIGLKALWDIQPDLEAGRLVACLTDYWCDTINLYACYASRAHIPNRVRVFTDFVMQQLNTPE